MGQSLKDKKKQEKKKRTNLGKSDSTSKINSLSASAVC